MLPSVYLCLVFHFHLMIAGKAIRAIMLYTHVPAGSSKQPHQITLTIIPIYNSLGYSTCTPARRLNNVVEVLYVWA